MNKISSKKHYSITNDIIFKLSLSNNKEALIKLCNTFIEELKDVEFKPEDCTVKITNNINLDVKSSYMDVRFDILNEYTFNYEMQKQNTPYVIDDRILKYYTDLVSKSYPKRMDYKHKKCYSLWFFDFNYYGGDNPIHTFTLNEKESKNSIKNAGSITIVEIKKLKNYNKNNLWFKLFYNSNYKELKGEDMVMNRLVDQIEELNADEAIQFEIEERERQFTERNALIEGYKEQALKQGLQQGLQQGIEQGIERGKADAKYEIARNMISEGIDIELISKMTGLAIDEIQKL